LQLACLRVFPDIFAQGQVIAGRATVSIDIHHTSQTLTRYVVNDNPSSEVVDSKPPLYQQQLARLEHESHLVSRQRLHHPSKFFFRIHSEKIK